MRSEQEIMNLVVTIAKQDDRIEAVLLNGSRANPEAVKDNYQDYDIVWVTNFIEDIISDPDYPNQFGDILIMQKPDETSETDHYDCFAYLMQFKDMTRIDLRLIKPESLDTHLNDAFSRVLLDKKQAYGSYHFARKELYETKQLSEAGLNRLLKEIYWVSTYVVKGLIRRDFMYSEFMISHPIRTAFIEVLKQDILAQKEVKTLSFGKYDKGIIEYIVDEDQFLKLYSNKSLEDIEANLRFILTETDKIARKIEQKRKVNLNHNDYVAAMIVMEKLLENKERNGN
ncbi:aminoglycoside 6-adenylyltransferase [Streptococcus pseudoporcinus]|uniref:Streptomycin adenylyltransferase n=1 Tax=Streptococcus pseudoporcinus LQ 940-04 TaxID=875093 RepID=G5K9H6_9STRE|nr:aminoglycoside 6-adenylyltransferase [Streptococcus pseudoporcinus]EFR43664.1 streptomycin adenylyltransferase [Streptococcus pseudoporcinus SPIN 20026]EHI64484.1 streptomycin adenylyltransferase [Streptococcus pseudoporcinus LQ 940-04]VEF93649.1 aminoglycoside 6-adenylyltranserase [Streptococcus pseudoporcinus]